MEINKRYYKGFSEIILSFDGYVQNYEGHNTTKGQTLGPPKNYTDKIVLNFHLLNFKQNL